MADVRLTTTDNHWNPFTHFDEWLAFDSAHDYGCVNYIGRTVPIADELSDDDNDVLMNSAIDSLVSLGIPLGTDVNGNPVYYTKVHRPS